MITGLEPLGRDALGEEGLTALVRTITGDPAAVAGAVRVEPVDYRIGTPSTESLHRVFGTTLDGGDWSCFVKKLQSVRHSPIIEFVPVEYRQSFIDYMPWQLEIAVHQSGIGDLMPPGLRLAHAYRIDVYDDDRATLWMENVVQEWGPWPMDRFERAAYLLGRLSARRQPHLVEPLLDRVVSSTPGTALRYYAGGRVMRSALPALADPQTWRHPLLSAAVCHLGDHRLRDDLLALGERVPAVLDALEALPQCYQHGDASPQNLLVPHDSPDEFVAIDWGFDCPQAVGFDLGQLLIGLAHAGELAPEALPAVHRVILKGFQEGLAEDGLQVTEEEVLYGYLGSLLIRAAFTALPLEMFGMANAPLELFEQRVQLTRTLVDLVSPVV
ncbi:phosphotransferase [Kribbella sindirgiensis]|uniref:Aminoglycoside phosphotransferase n=1 Tax=Kribbella sindirgiensis TaxID=1124744 RepID=A0A4V2M5F5_9ACTN|nr:phosphotransferase [Kribbella sindirgiensis]TCC39622.1 aminoglycoside phosphotransferase [Kribbella sindirgiensis]